MRRMKCALAVAAVCGGALFVVVGSEAASANAPARVTLAGTAAPSKARANHVGSVSDSSTVNFQVVLNLRDQAGAQALGSTSVSTPGTANYRQFPTAAQWEAQFSPSQGSVAQARAWLAQEGFTVGSTSASDRITIPASGTAAQVEHAFGVSLSEYSVAGHTVREATGNLSIPASLAGIVTGALGINQTVATPADGQSGYPGAQRRRERHEAIPNQFPPAPPAFLTAPPCRKYYGQTRQGVTAVRQRVSEDGARCGVWIYAASVAFRVRGRQGDTGKGSTEAIIDAYGSSTIARMRSGTSATTIRATRSRGQITGRSIRRRLMTRRSATRAGGRRAGDRRRGRPRDGARGPHPVRRRPGLRPGPVHRRAERNRRPPSQRRNQFVGRPRR